MGIQKESEIKELYEYRSFFNNDGGNKSADYENTILSKLMSNVMFRNDITSTFLNEIQKKFVWMIESTLVVRNFFNYTVHKYYNKHTN